MRSQSQPRTRAPGDLLVCAVLCGLLAGCSVGPRCVPGASAPCACIGGGSGAQVCQSDGTFATCVCPAPDGGAPDGGGVCVALPPGFDGPFNSGLAGGQDAHLLWFHSDQTLSMQRLGCDYVGVSAGGAWSRADGGVNVTGVSGPDGVASGLYSPDGGELIVLGNGFIGHWYRGGICVQGCNDAGQPAGFAPCAVQDFYADCHSSSDGG